MAGHMALGSPVIAFGSDIDGIPEASQKPGVAWHEPTIEGAPGHGEGHNSGQAVNVTSSWEPRTRPWHRARRDDQQHFAQEYGR